MVQISANTIETICVWMNCTSCLIGTYIDLNRPNLRKKHKEDHDISINTHKLLGEDGTIETLFPDPHYTIETHMPLSNTPRLDLYFTPSELLTLSLLLTACVEHTCRRNSEYCLLSFKCRSIHYTASSEDNNNE